jgi:Domain of unknown function (DUF4349)/Putative zinc-finger
MNSSTHLYAQEEVMAYLDGELSADRAAGVAAHLRECAECAELAEQMRGVSAHLTNWSVEPAPVSLTKNLQTARPATLAKENKPKGIGAWLDRRFAPLRGRWILGAAGAAAVGVLLLAVGLQNSRRAQYAGPLNYAKTTESNQSMAPSPSPSPKASETAADLYRERAQMSESLDLHDSSTAAFMVHQSTEPMIARTASISLIVKDFGPVEATVKAIAQRHSGYIASLNTASPQDSARTLSATLQIPSAQLESAVTELKQLGRVDQETQSGEEVTKEFIDRAARLKNARATEQRLLDVLREHTGKVKDILDAEQEIARVRGEIEQMEADQRALQTRVDFATVQLSVQEEYKASIQVTPPSTSTRLRNAAIQGYKTVVESVIGFGVWALQSLPALVLWALILFVPARWMWKRFRRTAVSQS